MFKNQSPNLSTISSVQDDFMVSREEFPDEEIQKFQKFFNITEPAEPQKFSDRMFKSEKVGKRKSEIKKEFLKLKRCLLKKNHQKRKKFQNFSTQATPKNFMNLTKSAKIPKKSAKTHKKTKTIQVHLPSYSQKSPTNHKMKNLMMQSRRR